MPATGEKGLGIMPILAIILIVIIAAVIVLVFRLSKTHASAQESISSGWNVMIIILSILGAVFGLFIPGWRIQHIILAVILVLLAVIKKRKKLFTLYGIATTACLFWIIFLFRDGFGLRLIIALVGGTLAAMGMMIIGVWSEKKLLVWLALPILLVSGFFTHYLNWYLTDYITIIIAALYVHGLNASQKTEANSNLDAVQPVTMASVASPSDSSVTHVAPLFIHDNIIVDQKVRMFKFGNAYGLYDLDGNVIGNVVQDDISGGAKAAQIMLGKKMKSMQSFTVVIYDGNGARVGGVSRRGMGYVSIEDAMANSIGIMKRGKLVTESGEVLASIKMAGLSKTNVLGADGQVIGSLNQKWNGLVKTALTSADKYLVIFEPGTSVSQRAMILALCIGFDMITE